MVKKAAAETAPDQQQPYDNLLKSLLEGQEKQMLPYFVPDVDYLKTLNVEVIRTPLRVDRVYLVKHKGRRKIVHLEFESGPNNDMATRLLDYHTYLYRKYQKLPVLSMIVYPFPTKMAESPLREVDEDGEILTFHFKVFPCGKLKLSSTSTNMLSLCTLYYRRWREPMHPCFTKLSMRWYNTIKATIPG